MRSLRSASLVRIAALSFPILTGVAWGQLLPLEGIACASFRVGDLERSRGYYTGRLGYQQAFELKNPGGTPSAFFKVNEDQYIELQPGLSPAENVRLTRIAFQTTDIESLRRMLSARGLNPPAAAHTSDGNLAFSLHDPQGQRLRSLAAGGCGRAEGRCRRGHAFLSRSAWHG